MMKNIICAVLVGLLNLGLLTFNSSVIAQAGTIRPFPIKATIDIKPPNPTSKDSILALVTVNVVLPNPCYQVSFSTLGKTGNVFKATVVVIPPPPKKVCIQIITEVTRSRLYPLGKLQPGSYRFELYGCVKQDNVCLLSLLVAKTFQVRNKA